MWSVGSENPCKIFSSDEERQMTGVKSVGGLGFGFICVVRTKETLIESLIAGPKINLSGSERPYTEICQLDLGERVL